ncbi:nucleotidyltransferase family protein [Alicyclobacillus pomorum]|jgi:mannose-1-phosphate guanylyltransferase|uniref:nucleotidyltransferase family protein n=1 Tax=Alicyclobacillus pomorum TaxID=204470 RepID=UPI0004289C09|nr:NDP-sugar synthase [Alicyclobacillus pomorum]
MKALLLAGGLGTRLRPLTENLPKPMAPVANRPWLEHLILHLKEQGIEQFVIAVKHHADTIRNHFGDGRSLGVEIEYAVERQLMGTAGAIKNAESMLSDRFLVLNADIIHQIQLIPLLDFHAKHGGLVTIGLTEVDDPTQYGVVEQTASGRIVRFVEKPPRHAAPSNRVNAGIYVMEKQALRWIPADRETSIERETFPTLIQQTGRVYGTVIRGYWLDMGTLDRYLQLHRDVLDGRFRAQLPYTKKEPGIWIGRGVRMATDVQLVPPVIIGDDVVLERGCTVGPYAVVGDRAVLGRNVHCSRSVIWPDTRLEVSHDLNGVVVSPHFIADCEPDHNRSTQSVEVLQG